MNKILLWDIENSPNTVYTWGTWEQNAIEVIEPWYILSIAYKWLGDKQTHILSLRQYPGYKRGNKTERQMLRDFQKVLSQADFVIAHNGDKHDIKKLNTRAIFHGLEPFEPFKAIDTLKMARKYFAFNSNKLDDLGEYLGVGRKMKHSGFETWKGCMHGDIPSWQEMEKYNKQDVILLEKVYERLRGWHTTHPNINIGTDNHGACPSCGSTNFGHRGMAMTRTHEYPRLRCKDCGRSFSGKKEKLARPIIYN